MHRLWNIEQIMYFLWNMVANIEQKMYRIEMVTSGYDFYLIYTPVELKSSYILHINNYGSWLVKPVNVACIKN